MALISNTNGAARNVNSARRDNTFKGIVGQTYATGRRLSYEAFDGGVATREEKPRARDAVIDGYVEAGTILRYDGTGAGVIGNTCYFTAVEGQGAGTVVVMHHNHMNDSYGKTPRGAVALDTSTIEAPPATESLEDRAMRMAEELASLEAAIAEKAERDAAEKAEQEKAADEAALARVIARGLIKG